MVKALTGKNPNPKKGNTRGITLKDHTERRHKQGKNTEKIKKGGTPYREKGPRETPLGKFPS